MPDPSPSPSPGHPDPWGELSAPTVDFVILADRAEVVSGKLYVMGGGWDRLMVSDLSAPSPMSIAVAILVPWGATNQQHRVAISTLDADGNPSGLSAEFGFNAGRPPWAEPTQEQRVVFALPLTAVTFARYGSYVLQVHVNGVLGKRITFQVAPSHPPQI